MSELVSKIKVLLSKMSTNLSNDDSLTVERLNWLYVVFEEQDDAYIECLLCCLDTHISDRDPLFSPYPLFFQFLETFDFDTSIVMDWLVSPETCFLLYISRLLKVILSEWTLFVKAAHDRYPQNCGHDSIANTLCKNKKGYNYAGKVQDEVATPNQGTQIDLNLVGKGPVSETVAETNSEGSSQDQIASLSQGLSAIMAYSDSDSDEMKIIHPSNQKAVFQNTANWIRVLNHVTIQNQHLSNQKLIYHVTIQNRHLSNQRAI
ncbi:hypothetical protein LOTGIDRAFT_157866 [Lottia gigantea]|uniref:Protein Lines N-terminal domain-containing protein n=1 Tax=Lottia gigantea TaxID=225164 RepID=V4B2H2_LOTGI|nr:hypothetical protein LOTGIDRAFT_157866 [Lottia gigantea]ESP00587.1 hypothetical protein LOTGIDRAFT_157866 [Lottia gigantea]